MEGGGVYSVMDCLIPKADKCMVFLKCNKLMLECSGCLGMVAIRKGTREGDHEQSAGP